MSDFEDVRSALHQVPSEGAWRHLCEVLLTYHGEAPFKEVILPYCQGALTQWPVWVRSAPREWFPTPPRRSRSQRLIPLITHLNLTRHPNMRASWSPAGRGSGEARDRVDEQLTPLSWLLHVTALSLCHTGLTARTMAQIVENPALSAVRYLRLGHSYRPVRRHHSRYDDGDPQHTLYNRIGDRGLGALLDSPQMSAVCELDVSGNGITSEGFERLLRTPRERSWEALNLSSSSIEARPDARCATPHPSPSCGGSSSIGSGAASGSCARWQMPPSSRR